MLDPAYMLIHAGHLTGESEMIRVFQTLHRENHLPFGQPPTLEPESWADFLWFSATIPRKTRTVHPRVFYRGEEITMTYKWIGVGLYMLALLAIGVVASRRMSVVRDYYAGNKRFGFLAAAFSARATGESAWLLLASRAWAPCSAFRPSGSW